MRLQNLDRSFLSVNIRQDIKLLKYRVNDRIKCSVMLPFKIARNKRNGSIAFFEMTGKCYFILTLSKKPIYLVILKETRQLVLPCNKPQQQFNPLRRIILDSVNNGEALGAVSL